ncbi:MAG TPA: hypothetical protein VLN42_11600 [Casimicrobiaceae bacterium]|nr:hypothetical protein [Casimicrobiaceae bacterium]
MNDNDRSAPRVPPKKDEPVQKPKERGGDVRHIIDTGLPPGISVDEAKDPGAQTPRNPADDRS